MYIIFLVYGVPCILSCFSVSRLRVRDGYSNTTCYNPQINYKTKIRNHQLIANLLFYTIIDSH